MPLCTGTCGKPTTAKRGRCYREFCKVRPVEAVTLPVSDFFQHDAHTRSRAGRLASQAEQAAIRGGYVRPVDMVEEVGDSGVSRYVSAQTVTAPSFEAREFARKSLALKRAEEREAYLEAGRQADKREQSRLLRRKPTPTSSRRYGARPKGTPRMCFQKRAANVAHVRQQRSLDRARGSLRSQFVTLTLEIEALTLARESLTGDKRKQARQAIRGKQSALRVVVAKLEDETRRVAGDAIDAIASRFAPVDGGKPGIPPLGRECLPDRPVV
jgi:hypothetical protein